MFSLKMAVASAGALTAAVALGLAAPALSSLLLAEIPRAYVTLLAWLKPPYLYFIINGIIISIAAVSRFHKPSIETSAPVPATSRPELIAPPEPVDAQQDHFPQLVFSLTAAKSEFGESRSILPAQALAKYGHEEEAVEDVISRTIWPQQPMELREPLVVLPKQIEKFEPLVVLPKYGHEEEAVEDVISRTIWPQEQIEITEPLVVFSKHEAKSEFDELQPILTTPVMSTRMEAAAVVVENAVSRPIWLSHERKSKDTLTEHRTMKTEKPLVYSRIGHHHHHRRSLTDGKTGLGVARQKRSETLEGTWKTITDGRAVPLARHLKKSDTLPDSNRGGRDEEMAATRLVRKTETFNERTSRRPGNAPSSGGGRLHKEPSLGQDDLNRKVEAFINKFNEEMRLQRQESMQQYNDMIKRGSH